MNLAFHPNEKSLLPTHLQQKAFISTLEPSDVYGESTVKLKHDGQTVTGFTEIYCKQELFYPEFSPMFNDATDGFIRRILEKQADKKGELTEFLAFNIETYCQDATVNGTKGVSRATLINERGERILDTQIKLVNAQSSNRKQAMMLR